MSFEFNFEFSAFLILNDRSLTLAGQNERAGSNGIKFMVKSFHISRQSMNSCQLQLMDINEIVMGKHSNAFTYVLAILGRIFERTLGRNPLYSCAGKLLRRTGQDRGCVIGKSKLRFKHADDCSRRLTRPKCWDDIYTQVIFGSSSFYLLLVILDTP